MRKPRENGWLDFGGITHHINTRQAEAYHRDMRTATCGVGLRFARRVPLERVDCMTCIVHVSRRPRLPPRPTPAKNTWWTKGGVRHVRSTNDPWRASCGVSLRTAYTSIGQPNCSKCCAALDQKGRERG